MRIGIEILTSLKAPRLGYELQQVRDREHACRSSSSQRRCGPRLDIGASPFPSRRLFILILSRAQRKRLVKLWPQKASLIRLPPGCGPACPVVWDGASVRGLPIPLGDRQEISWTIWGPSVSHIGSRPIERNHRRSSSTSRISRLRSDQRWGAIGHSKVQVISCRSLGLEFGDLVGLSDHGVRPGQEIGPIDPHRGCRCRRRADHGHRSDDGDREGPSELLGDVHDDLSTRARRDDSVLIAMQPEPRCCHLLDKRTGTEIAGRRLDLGEHGREL